MCRKLIFLISIVLVLVLVSNVSAGVVAHYKFDETSGSTAYDSSGNNYDGMAKISTGAPIEAYWEPGIGKYPGCIRFEKAEGDYCIETPNDVFNHITNQITISVWVSWDDPATMPDQHNTLFSMHGGPGPAYDGILGIETGYPSEDMTFWDAAGFAFYAPGVDDWCYDWNHYAFVKDVDETYLRIYLDGEIVAEGASAAEMIFPADVARIGVCTDTWHDKYTGFMDDFRIYDIALSGAEIKELILGIEDPNLASEADPRNGAENVCPDVVLSWKPGQYATSHDVYFGTDFDNVNDATDPNVLPGRGRQVLTSYDPPELFELGQTYYWRIDEVNDACSPYLWKGRVWSFTVEQGKAHVPDPINGAFGVPADKVLSWTPSCLATSHDVYFGTDFNDVNDATDPNTLPGRGRQVTTSYDPPGTLASTTTYYWRVDEVNDPCTWKGDVWSFMAGGGLLMHYKFDETEDDTAYDSSGLGNDGTVDEGIWDPDGHDAGCLAFVPKDTEVLVPPTVLSNIDKEITVAVWLNTATPGPEENVVFETGAGDFFLNATIPDQSSNAYWRAGNDTNDVLSWTDCKPADWVGSWNHFAFVKNENEGTMRIYLNGLPAAEKTGASTDTLYRVQNKQFKIGGVIILGAIDTERYMGKMDDFRVYDCALSAVEIASLFRGGDLGIAWSPDPTNGAKDVPRYVGLSWLPGDFAVSHDVYFGTDFDDVNDANDPNVLPGRGRQDPCSYDPGPLDLDTTYYWRIDEVNDPCVWKGDVWRFTVANFLIVDNMEDYNDIKPGRIYDTWHDWSQYDPVGGKYPTAAELTLETADANVHGGRQSMKFQYNNSDSGAWMFYRNISEIDANTIGPLMHLEIGQDWTILDMKVLTLHFIGHLDNDANEQMYVALADSAGRTAVVPYGYYIDEDMNDIKKREWQEWNILLEDFNDINDVNLADVNNVYIGFGNRENPTVGGSGVVFFDDIRLYSSKCVASRIEFAADVTDDCVVDFGDIKVMGEHWLLTDANLLPVVNPGTTGLVGHWKLDGNANDSQGTNHGGVQGNYSWVTGHIGPYALEFTNGRVLVPDAAVLRPQYQVSASAWIYYSGDPGDSSRVVIKGKNDFEAYAIEVSEGECTYYVGDVNGQRYFAGSKEGELWHNDWIHLAGTYDGSIAKCYVNGQVVDTNDQAIAIPLSQDTTGLAIGNKPDALDRPFRGTIDDVRVYNYGLSAAEVAYLASEGDGYVPLRSPANIYDVAEEIEGQYQQVINFRDYAKLTDKWLEEKIWPPP